MTALAFLIIFILSFQLKADDCRSQFILNPRAVQRVVEIGTKTVANHGLRALEAQINSALVNLNEKPIVKDVPNFYFGGFSGTSKGVLRFNKTSVKNLQMGEPKIDCPQSGWKCKVQFPINKVDLVTDFKLNKLVCADPRTPIKKCGKWKEENHIEINRYKVGFDMAGSGAKEMPEISFDVDILPGAPMEKMLQVDPVSVHLKVVPEMAFGLNADLDLLDKEWKQIKDKIKNPDKCKFDPSLD